MGTWAPTKGACAPAQGWRCVLQADTDLDTDVAGQHTNCTTRHLHGRPVTHSQMSHRQMLVTRRGSAQREGRVHGGVRSRTTSRAASVPGCVPDTAMQLCRGPGGSEA